MVGGMGPPGLETVRVSVAQSPTRVLSVAAAENIWSDAENIYTYIVSVVTCRWDGGGGGEHHGVEVYPELAHVGVSFAEPVGAGVAVRAGGSTGYFSMLETNCLCKVEMKKNCLL